MKSTQNNANTESSPPTSIEIISTSINHDKSGSTADAATIEDEGAKQGGSNAKVGCPRSKPESSKDSEEISNTE